MFVLQLIHLCSLGNRTELDQNFPIKSTLSFCCPVFIYLKGVLSLQLKKPQLHCTNASPLLNSANHATRKSTTLGKKIQITKYRWPLAVQNLQLKILNKDFYFYFCCCVDIFENFCRMQKLEAIFQLSTHLCTLQQPWNLKSSPSRIAK